MWFHWLKKISLSIGAFSASLILVYPILLCLRIMLQSLRVYLWISVGFSGNWGKYFLVYKSIIGSIPLKSSALGTRNSEHRNSLVSAGQAWHREFSAWHFISNDLSAIYLWFKLIELGPIKALDNPIWSPRSQKRVNCFDKIPPEVHLRHFHHLYADFSLLLPFLLLYVEEFRWRWCASE